MASRPSLRLLPTSLTVAIVVLAALSASPSAAQVVIRERVEATPPRPVSNPVLSAAPRKLGEPLRLLPPVPNAADVEPGARASASPRPFSCGTIFYNGGAVTDEVPEGPVWVSPSEPGTNGWPPYLTAPGPHTFEFSWGGGTLYDLEAQRVTVRLRDDSDVGGHFVDACGDRVPVEGDTVEVTDNALHFLYVEGHNEYLPEFVPDSAAMFGGQTLTARFDVEFFYRWWEDRDGNGSPERQDTLYTGTATIPIRPPRALLELGTGDPMAEGLSLRLRPADGLNTKIPDSTAFRFEVDPTDRSYAEVARVGESGHALTAIYAESAADNVRLVVDPDLAPLDPTGCVVVGVLAQTERDYGLDPLTLDVPVCLEPRLEVAFARDTLRYGDRTAVTVTAADHVTGGVDPAFPITVSVDTLVYEGYFSFEYLPAELVHTGTGERGATLEGVPFADLEGGLVELAADGETTLGDIDAAVVRVRGDQPLGPLAPTGAGTAYVQGGWLDVEPTFDSLYVDQARVLEAVVTDASGEVPLDPDRLFEVWTYPYQDARAGVLVNDRTGERGPDYLAATYADLRAGHVRFLADTTEAGPPAARTARARRSTDGAAGRGARRAESARLDLLRERARERGPSAVSVRGTARRSAHSARVAGTMDERWVGVEVYDVDSYSLYGWVDLVVLPRQPTQLAVEVSPGTVMPGAESAVTVTTLDATGEPIQVDPNSTVHLRLEGDSTLFTVRWSPSDGGAVQEGAELSVPYQEFGLDRVVLRAVDPGLGVTTVGSLIAELNLAGQPEPIIGGSPFGMTTVPTGPCSAPSGARVAASEPECSGGADEAVSRPEFISYLKDELQCSLSANSETQRQEASRVFEAGSRRMMRMRTGSYTDYQGNVRPVDGISRGIGTNKFPFIYWRTASILEAKLVDSYAINDDTKRLQSYAHIEETASTLRLPAPGDVASGNVSVVYVSTAAQNLSDWEISRDELDPNRSVVQRAERRGVALYHLRLYRDDDGFYVRGHLLTQPSSFGTGLSIRSRWVWLPGVSTPPVVWERTPIAFDCSDSVAGGNGN